MGRTIKTIIDGVPVELEIVKIGSSVASENSSDLTKAVIVNDGNGGSTVPAITTPSQNVRILQIGDDKSPATASDVEKVNKAINQNKDMGQVLEDIANCLQATGKDWWKSKVIWINLITIIGSCAAYLGFDFKSHNINPETIATLITVVLGVVNLYYRKGTDIPINPIFGK